MSAGGWLQRFFFLKNFPFFPGSFKSQKPNFNTPQYLKVEIESNGFHRLKDTKGKVFFSCHPGAGVGGLACSAKTCVLG